MNNVSSVIQSLITATSASTVVVSNVGTTTLVYPPPAVINTSNVIYTLILSNPTATPFAYAYIIE